MADRATLRDLHGSVAGQALREAVVDVADPVRAAVCAIRLAERRAARQVARRARRACHAIAQVPGNMVHGLGCGPAPTMGDPSAGHNLLSVENLPAAPALTINPIDIRAIPEVYHTLEPLQENLEDNEDLQHAVVHQNSKLIKKSDGQYVVKFFERHESRRQCEEADRWTQERHSCSQICFVCIAYI